VDTLEEVYEIIDQDDMLEEHGGKRQHDVTAWVATQIERETNGTFETLGDCLISTNVKQHTWLMEI